MSIAIRQALAFVTILTLCFRLLHSIELHIHVHKPICFKTSSARASNTTKAEAANAHNLTRSASDSGACTQALVRCYHLHLVSWAHTKVCMSLASTAHRPQNDAVMPKASCHLQHQVKLVLQLLDAVHRYLVVKLLSD